MNPITWSKEFLRDDFNKALIVALTIVGLTAYFFIGAPASESGESFAHFFYSPSCPHCSELHPHIKDLELRYGINIIEHDISQNDSLELFNHVCDQRGLHGFIPTTIVGNQSFIGSDKLPQIEAAVRRCVEDECRPVVFEGCACGGECANETCAPETCACETCGGAGSKEKDFVISLPFIGETDLGAYSLPVLAVTLGLIDGFNPCAMWVLVFLIAVLLELRDKRKMWLIVGSFLLASGVLYFLFMTLWLNVFLLIGYQRAVMVLIGLLALGVGTMFLRELWKTKGHLVCKVGDAESKKKTMGRINRLVNSPLTVVTILGIIALAFVVNSMEFACSAGIPAVFTQILALNDLGAWEHYGYILLYDLFFMLDDLIIYGLAAFSINAMATNERYVKYSHIIGGLLLLFLGTALLLFP